MTTAKAAQPSELSPQVKRFAVFAVAAGLSTWATHLSAIQLSDRQSDEAGANFELHAIPWKRVIGWAYYESIQAKNQSDRVQ